MPWDFTVFTICVTIHLKKPEKQEWKQANCSIWHAEFRHINSMCICRPNNAFITGCNQKDLLVL